MKVLHHVAALAGILCFFGLPFNKITNRVREVLRQKSIMEPKSTEETYRRTGTEIQIEYQTEKAKNPYASRDGNPVTWEKHNQEVQRSFEDRRTGTEIQIEYQTEKAKNPYASINRNPEKAKNPYASINRNPEKAKNPYASRDGNPVTWEKHNQEVQRSFEEANCNFQNMEMEMKRY